MFSVNFVKESVKTPRVLELQKGVFFGPHIFFGQEESLIHTESSCSGNMLLLARSNKASQTNIIFLYTCVKCDDICYDIWQCGEK